MIDQLPVAEIDQAIAIDRAERYEYDETLNTVEYHAANGMVFELDGVKWYEMQEAFNELSRQAYEAGTYVNYVIVH